MSKQIHRIDWWYCGDECCCSYPYVRAVTLPLTKVQVNGIYWEQYAVSKTLEAGPWGNDGDNLQEQWDWIITVARKYNVENLAELEEEYSENYSK